MARLKIVCNGCSFTAAEHLYLKGSRRGRFTPEELQEYEKRKIIFENPIEALLNRPIYTGRGWSYWLDKRHENVETVNLAGGGGGNDRIFRTTVDYIEQHGTDAVAIQWSAPNRWEYQCYESGEWVKVNANFTQGGVDRKDKDYIKWVDMTNVRYTSDFGKYRNYRNELALKQFCAERDIPIYFWIPHNLYLEEEWIHSPRVIHINSYDPNDGIHPDQTEYQRIARIIDEEFVSQLG